MQNIQLILIVTGEGEAIKGQVTVCVSKMTLRYVEEMLALPLSPRRSTVPHALSDFPRGGL